MVSFQFLRGCYIKDAFEKLIGTVDLSIPSGMLRFSRSGRNSSDFQAFQFLRGCYCIPVSRLFLQSSPSFNSFGDATIPLSSHFRGRRRVLSIPSGMLPFGAGAIVWELAKSFQFLRGCYCQREAQRSAAQGIAFNSFGDATSQAEIH